MKARNFDYPVPVRGRMARIYLQQIVDDASRFRDSLQDHDTLPAWVEYYVATSADRLQAASRYMDVTMRFQPSGNAMQLGGVEYEVAGHAYYPDCTDPYRACDGPSVFSGAYGDAASGLRSSGVPGVFIDENGAVLTSNIKTFLKALRSKVNFDFVVTSGVRSLEEQAQAMWTKWQKFGWQDLVNVYDDRLLTGMENAKSAADILIVLKQKAAQGMGVSAHTRGDAVDIRTRGLSQPQRDAIIQAAYDLGLKGRQADEEKDHIHIQGFGSIMDLLTIEAKRNWPWVAGAAVLGAAGIWYAWKQTRKLA